MFFLFESSQAYCKRKCAAVERKFALQAKREKLERAGRALNAIRKIEPMWQTAYLNDGRRSS